MAAPYLIVGIAGDSNAMTGKYHDPTIDITNSKVFQRKRDGTVLVANESLDNSGAGGTLGPPDTTTIGSTLALCRLLATRGKIPSGYSVLIVPGAMGGTAFLNYWATTPAYVDGVTGGRRALQPFIDALNAALAIDSRNRLWFFDWNHGENDLIAQQSYQDNMVATWGEIRSTVSTANRAPLLITGEPPNRGDPLLGNTPNAGVDAALRNCTSYLENCAYINTDDLTAYDASNAQIHHTAVSHRGGGANNAPLPTVWDNVTTFTTGDHVYGTDNFVYRSNGAGNTGNNPTTDAGVHWTKTAATVNGTVANPICERKYSALLTLKWPMRASWT